MKLEPIKVVLFEDHRVISMYHYILNEIGKDEGVLFNIFFAITAEDALAQVDNADIVIADLKLDPNQRMIKAAITREIPTLITSTSEDLHRLEEAEKIRCILKPEFIIKKFAVIINDFIFQLVEKRAQRHA